MAYIYIHMISQLNVVAGFLFASFFCFSMDQVQAQNPTLITSTSDTLNVFICGLDPITGTKTAALRDLPGIYRGKFFYEKEKAPVKEEHSWLLYLENGKGEAMEGAKVYVDGINYDAGLGFATPPTVSKYVGNGHYRVEGVKFSVAGTWTMRFQVLWDGVVDILSFDIEI